MDEKICQCDSCRHSRKFEAILNSYFSHKTNPQTVEDRKFMEDLYLSYVIAVNDDAFSEHKIKKFFKALGSCKAQEILSMEL